MRPVSRDGQVDPKGHRFPQDLRVLWNKTQTQSAVELSDSQEQTNLRMENVESHIDYSDTLID